MRVETTLKKMTLKIFIIWWKYIWTSLQQRCFNVGSMSVVLMSKWQVTKIDTNIDQFDINLLTSIKWCYIDIGSTHCPHLDVNCLVGLHINLNITMTMNQIYVNIPQVSDVWEEREAGCVGGRAAAGPAGDAQSEESSPREEQVRLII